MLRLLSGYVRFSAGGGFGERFVNLCDFCDIKVRRLQKNGNSIEGFVAAKDYRKLRTVAKKSGMTLVCLSKHGLPFFAFRNRERVGLLVGAVFFCVFMAVMSLFVWSVDVTGSEELSREEVLLAAAELGLGEGAFRPKTDVRFVADSLVTKFNGRLQWAAVNIIGSRAVIELRDYTPKAEEKVFSDPCNIVADFDGLLLSLEVYNGTKANTEGNGVKKGDLLISGVVENRDLSSSFREARGKITALHSAALSFSANGEVETRAYKEESHVYSFRCFWLKIPLGFLKGGENFEEFEEEEKLFLSSTPLPLSIIKTTRLYYETLKTADGCELERALDGYAVTAFEKFKNTRVLSSEISVSRKENNVTVSGENDCIDFIGKKQPIQIEE